MVVETNLSDRTGSRSLIEPASRSGSCRIRIICEQMGLMRMNPRRKAHGRPAGADLAGLLELGVILCGKNYQASGKACFSRTRNHGVEVPGKLAPCQVTVGIDHRQRTLVPGVAGSALRTIGPPPSGLAASTIPFDSIPISLAGLRFATMTTVLPTRASGS